MKRAYIIHGWDGSPDEPLHAWLRAELTNRGYEAVVPLMPNPDEPAIDAWVGALRELIPTPNNDVLLIGHSIGCQAILRYLETLSADVRVGGVVLIAPWFTLQGLETDEERALARAWEEAPIDYERIRVHTRSITCIFSDNDPVVPLSNAALFEERLHTKNIVEHGRGHFTADDGVRELPSALEAVLAHE